MGRPLSLDDELDALLDAPPGESRLHVSAELAPLVAVAAALRAELATVVPDPGVARRQISHAIGMPRLARAQLAGNGHGGSGWGIGTEVASRSRRQGDPSVPRMGDWRDAKPGPSRLRRRRPRAPRASPQFQPHRRQPQMDRRRVPRLRSRPCALRAAGAARRTRTLRHHPPRRHRRQFGQRQHGPGLRLSQWIRQLSLRAPRQPLGRAVHRGQQHPRQGPADDSVRRRRRHQRE